MLRKTILTLAALGSLGAAALAPTSASAAWGWHGGYGYWPHRPFFGRVFVPPVRVMPAPAYAYTAAPCLRRRFVPTVFGPQLRWVNVCAY